MSPAEVRKLLWDAGDLRYKLWPQQEPIYNAVRGLPRDVDEAVLLCARQFGKSHLGVLLAVEDCLRFPDRCILIVGPTYDQTREIVTPRLRRIIADAPPGVVRPMKSEKKWMIGDSELVIGGFDVNSSSQRGKTVQTIYIEEVVDSKPDHFLESMRSDLGPALTHSDAGKMVFLTTLPKLPDHPFITQTMVGAEINGALYVYTINDNKALTREQYEACVRRAGGTDTDDWKREYLCELIRDRNKVVIPDFDESVHVRAFDLPLRTTFEIFVDWGGVRDLTVALLTGFDFFNAKDLYIDEMVWKANTPTEVIVRDLQRWRDQHQVQRLVVDAPGQLLVDLRETYKLDCQMPIKDDWEASINQLAVRYMQKKLVIHERCKMLIQSCRSGTFNDRKTDFERTIALGHCDAIAAQMYANRGMDRSSPYPATILSPDHVFMLPKQQTNVPQSILPKSFSGRGMKSFGSFKR